MISLLAYVLPCVCLCVFFDLLTVLNLHRQHQSARGGPKRSWTNQDLMNALDDVWSKRMNTSQAARYHRIPYNSLLMYVRGKYGKTLNINVNHENNISSSIGTRSPTLSPQAPAKVSPATIPSEFLGDESGLRQIFAHSFPQHGNLPPHDLLHNFAMLSKVTAQNNIK